MRYLALATDYDGTLAKDGQVDTVTLDALKRWRESGRKLILVTGRQVDDLYQAFPRLKPQGIDLQFAARQVFWFLIAEIST